MEETLNQLTIELQVCSGQRQTFVASESFLNLILILFIELHEISFCCVFLVSHAPN